MKQILIFTILVIGVMSCKRAEFEKPNLDLEYKIESQSIDLKEGVVEVILSLKVWNYPGESTKINTYLSKGDATTDRITLSENLPTTGYPYTYRIRATVSPSQEYSLQAKLARPNGSVFFTGKPFKFTTIALRPSELKVSTKLVTLYSATSVLCNYEFIPDKEFQMTDKGVAYRKKGDVNFSYKSLSGGENVGEYVLKGLSGNTTYIITVYAKDVGGIKYGGEYEITTKSMVDYFLVSTSAANSIKATSVVIPVTLTERKVNDTGTTIREIGVMYSTDQSTWKKVMDSKVNIGTANFNITGLIAAQKYYYKACYTTSDEVTYSESIAENFTTSSYPPITTASINGIYSQYVDGKYISTVRVTMNGTNITLDQWDYAPLGRMGKWFGVSGTINTSTREMILSGSYYIEDSFYDRFTNSISLARGEVRDGEIVFSSYVDTYSIYYKTTYTTKTSTTFKSSVLKK